MAMNKTALIIHGAYGNPAENWFPWLREQLEALGYEVVTPPLPTPKHQHLEMWLERVEEYRQEWGDENTIFIGHSIGAAFVLRLLMSHTGEPIRAAFLVAGFITQLGDPKFDKLNASFLANSFDWERIKENCQKFFVYHSDNDPYVQLAKGEEMAKKLGVQITMVPDAGHFNAEAGYTEFDRLLQNIKALK